VIGLRSSGSQCEPCRQPPTAINQIEGLLVGRDGVLACVPREGHVLFQ